MLRHWGWRSTLVVTRGWVIRWLNHIDNRAGWGLRTFFSTNGNHLPSLSGVYGLKDFLCSDHLHGSFGGRIYSLKHFNKCKFVHQRTQEDEHYRENPSNHELLTVRGVDRRALLKMFRGQITIYCIVTMIFSLHLWKFSQWCQIPSPREILRCQNWISLNFPPLTDGITGLSTQKVNPAFSRKKYWRRNHL